MKTNPIATIFFFLIALLFAVPLRAQNEIKEQLSVPLSDPGKPGSLKVGIINGSIQVIGYSGKEVVIDATADASPTAKKADPVNDELANGMKRISNRSGFEITAEEKNNAVQVNTSFMKRNLKLTIKVPQRFSLKLSTVNGGDIVVENVSGDLEVTNVNGRIQLNNIAGSAVVNTVNGGLVATFKEVSSNTPMAFSTLNGNVDITFPANVKSNLKVKSDRGEVYSDFDIDVDKSQPKTSRSNQDGMYRVQIDDWVYGKINGGGSEVMMKTMHGNIYIRKAK